MSLLKLKSNPGARKRRKVVGRGNGSGHGTYSTRGMNGQRQRTGSTASPGFEGGQTPLYRKMPKLGGFKNINRVAYQVVNVGALNVFDENEEVNIAKLFERNLICRKNMPVKVLGDGELTKKLVVKVDKISASAKEKIEKANGKFEEMMKVDAETEK